MPSKHSVVAAFSGGKDSTALAYALKPKYLLYTSTGNELPPVEKHIRRVARDLKAKVIRPPGPTLDELITRFNGLPNFRMRWCTRLIKVMPAIQWMKDHPDAKLAVGLRHDEPSREGIYGFGEDRFLFPLRTKKWGLQEVLRFLECRDVSIPNRTDCAICFYQRLGEWYQLWRDWPGRWYQGEAWEKKTKHTFRSPSRDTWPASMRGLRKRFEKGDVPRGGYDVIKRERGCRVCSLEARYSPCVGCGYCCTAGPCYLAQLEHGGFWSSPCPELVERDGRKWCGLVERAQGQQRRDYMKGLAIGAGCSSTLFNTVRDAQIAKTKQRTNAEEEA